MIPALQVKLISFGICGGRLVQTSFFFARQPYSQISRYSSCDFLLDRGDVSQLPAVLLTPKLLVCACIHKFGAYGEVIAPLNDSASDQRLHAKFTRHLLGFYIVLFVTESRRA